MAEPFVKEKEKKKLLICAGPNVHQPLHNGHQPGIWDLVTVELPEMSSFHFQIRTSIF